ncbi:hypothetical protein Taro_030737 [Colocasia esculenta]|uniref:Uncharacterized protein n=1 Tax=Colocasia esculenta TaxID=4460 RepID=A0A843VH22_COLES|nr:hypothetical protein [Colocasia esculenta]
MHRTSLGCDRDGVQCRLQNATARYVALENNFATPGSVAFTGANPNLESIIRITPKTPIIYGFHSIYML